MVIYLNNFDVIVKTETHNVNDNMPKMNEKWCMKIEPARKLSSKGRASGGVIVGTKRNRKETVSLGETESECYVKIGKEIYLIPVYPNCNNYESYIG